MNDEKDNLLKIYGNTSNSNYQTEVRKITNSMNLSEANAEKSYAQALVKPKEKKAEKLAVYGKPALPFDTQT